MRNYCYEEDISGLLQKGFKLVCFGAGGFAKANLKDCIFLKDIQMFVDNNPKLWNAKINISGIDFEIMPPDFLFLDDASKYAVLVTTANYISIKNQLEHSPCHVYPLLKRADAENNYQPVLNALSKKRGKTIILMGTPEYGNLGDHAIAEAELAFFRDRCPEYGIIEISERQYQLQKNDIASRIVEDDIICITGGGFIGSLWMNMELLVRDIVSTYINNRIIIFPSTIHYGPDENGISAFEESSKIYQRHNKLTLCLRDSNSIAPAMDLLGKASEKDFVLTPDIALYLNKTRKNVHRIGILLCLRKDAESIISENDKLSLEAMARDFSESIAYTDTVIPNAIKATDRLAGLSAKYNEFAGCELVITDRLHGMIFSAITGTPCIALDNISGKVNGAYSWIKYLPYVKLASDIDEVRREIPRLLSLPRQEYNNVPLIPLYEKITKQILKGAIT